MLESVSAIPMIAVKDISKAKEFYQKVLDLDVEYPKMMGETMALCHSGGTDFMLYESDYAGTNKANTMAWSLGSRFDETMKQLKSKGVRFEQYKDLGMKIQDDVHISGDFKAAWFKDPDGNILHINNGEGTH